MDSLPESGIGTDLSPLTLLCNGGECPSHTIGITVQLAVMQRATTGMAMVKRLLEKRFRVLWLYKPMVRRQLHLKK